MSLTSFSTPTRDPPNPAFSPAKTTRTRRIMMMMVQQPQCLLFFFLVLCSSLAQARATMPTFFSADEARYDRYAACLAATEKLRREDCYRRHGEDHDGSCGSSTTAAATEEYAKQASRILNGLGSSLEEYNAIGREVLENNDLKRRVISQAFLYRVESSISSEKLPVQVDDATIRTVKGEKIRKFCQSMLEIERLRKAQLGQLQALVDFGTVNNGGTTTNAPPTIVAGGSSLTAVAPLLQPHARSIVEDFPKQATAIAKKYGLTVQEFNTMLHSTRWDRAFREKVQRAFVRQ